MEAETRCPVCNQRNWHENPTQGVVTCMNCRASFTDDELGQAE